MRFLALLVALLVVTDLVLMNQSMWLTVPVALLAAGLLLLLARWCGLSRSDLGLGSNQLGAGLRWAGLAWVLVLVGWLVVMVSPIFQSALSDSRTPDTLAQVLLKIFIIIPIRTVLLEELAFRGVIFGLVNKAAGSGRAVLYSSFAFGLWHIPPGLLIIGTNQALIDFIDGSMLRSVISLLGIVTFTTLAGVVFAQLRRRSGSLLAPMGLHWAVNGGGTLASYLRSVVA